MRARACACAILSRLRARADPAVDALGPVSSANGKRKSERCAGCAEFPSREQEAFVRIRQLQVPISIRTVSSTAIY
eukprot:6180240-Pleurochrysis_carterae.AAC.2